MLLFKGKNCSVICCLNTKKVERTEISETEMWSNTNHKKKKKIQFMYPGILRIAFRYHSIFLLFTCGAKPCLQSAYVTVRNMPSSSTFSTVSVLTCPPVTQIAHGASIYSTLISFYYLASEDYRFLINQLIFYQAKYPK